MGMNPTLRLLLGDGVIRRVALSQDILLLHALSFTSLSVPLGVATVPGTRGNVVRTVGLRALI